MAEDYYSLLGVNKNASSDEIKKSYRKLAVQHHPDKNAGDSASEQKFKEINAAYDILKNKDKRAAYDRYGENAFNGMGGGQANHGFDFGGGGGAAFSDIFEDLFGGGGRGRQQGGAANNRGGDLRFNMSISLEDAFLGNKKEIEIKTFVKCDPCHGIGSADKAGSSTCDTCHGAGRVRMQQGFFMVERTCSSCQGTGAQIKNPCKKCYGEGRVKKNKILSVKIPEGVEEGTRIRLVGEGEAGQRAGDSGDLYIFISVNLHKIFVREGNHIHCDVPLSFITSALGGHVDVPTIDGAKARITIPEGTQTGDQFRLGGKGMKVMRRSGIRGDMYVRAVVETPIKLTKKQKQLLKEFDELNEKKSSPQVEKFSSQVKNYLK